MTAVTTPSAGDDIEAAWGASVASALSPCGCVLLRTADQSITDVTDTVITFPTASSTEVLDTDGFHSGSTNTGRITVPTGGQGWYEIGFNLAFAADTTGQRQAWVELNGTTVILNVSNQSFGTNTNRFAAQVPYLLAAGDYVTLNVRQNSGGALDVLYVASFSTRFWALRKWPT